MGYVARNIPLDELVSVYRKQQREIELSQQDHINTYHVGPTLFSDKDVFHNPC